MTSNTIYIDVLANLAKYVHTIFCNSYVVDVNCQIHCKFDHTLKYYDCKGNSIIILFIFNNSISKTSLLNVLQQNRDV